MMEEMVDGQRPRDAVTIGAGVLAVLLHPVLVPVYITAFLAFVHPFLFAGYESGARLRLLLIVFVNLTLFPVVTVFLCWRLQFIGSVMLRTTKDRIIPLAATMIFYFWCWFVLRGREELPLLFRQFLMGCFIAVILAWMANIYFKVSLHALSMGGLFAFALQVCFGAAGASPVYIAVAAVVAGLVCSARMVSGAHRAADVYAGFVLGAVSQVAAAWFM